MNPRTLMDCAQAALMYSEEDARIIADAAEEITRLRAEVEEQARLLGMSGEREAKLLARVEKLEKVRAAARFLINEDAGVDDPAEDGWWEWEKNCEALRAALKEAKP